MIDEGHAGVLSIHAMTGDAVMRERLLAVFQILLAVRQWVPLILIADKEVVLGEGDRLRLELARRRGLASGERGHAQYGTCCKETAHPYSTT